MPTNIWDVTVPADTQLANLLGSDLRNFRLDTQQRMALISGTLAGRWNPGTDSQPLNWQGLLYFTTDTQQIFQWSGAAWVDVTQSILPSRTIFRDNTLHTHTGTVTTDTIYTVPINAGVMGVNSILRITATWTCSVQGVGSSVIKLNFGAANPLLINNGSVQAYNLGVEIGNRAASNSQIFSGVMTQNTTPFIQIQVMAIDTTVNQNLILTVQNANNGDTQLFNEFFVELL